MAYRLKIELEGLPRMSNLGNKSHWRYAHAEAMRWQTAVVSKVGIFKPLKPLKKAKLTLIRFSAVAPDYDGLVRGFKCVVDGLVRAGVLEDDKLENTGQWNCHWEKTSRAHGRILILVDEWV